MIKAIIFDFDGTLIDSEENYLLSDQQLLAQYGIAFTKEMKSHYIGMGNSEMMQKIQKDFHLPNTPQRLLDLKNEIYLEIAKKNTSVYAPVAQLVGQLYDRHYPLALASGTSPHVLLELLDHVGLKKFFSVIISSEEVARAKPEPDIFFESARRLRIEPQHCGVVEDSQYGVTAGKRAGMKVIAVPYLHSGPLAEAFHSADLLFTGGMRDFDCDRVVQWIEKQNL
jgi:HAD superfamily hydrolase (TIGR01509 family)